MICKTCSNEYDSSDHKPYVLFDCVHTFCFKCVSNVQNCPLCRQLIKSKTVNWDLLELIEEESLIEKTANVEPSSTEKPTQENQTAEKKEKKNKKKKNKTNKQKIDESVFIYLLKYY